MLKTLVASLYLWSNGIFRIVNGGMQALFEGFWMGLLPESVYDVISEKSYGTGDHYTNTKYLDSGFHFWEELAVRTYFAPGSRVLVASAGGGREIIALVRAGYRAAGFECSRAMVETGQRALAERGIAAPLVWAAPCTTAVIPEPSAPDALLTFNGLIVGWNGYCYISPRARRIEFLKSLRTQLEPGSPVLISMATRTPNARLLAWTPRVANAVRICTLRRPVFEAGDSFSSRPKMHFTRRQIELEITDAGFSVTRFYMWGGYGAVVAKA